MKLLVNIENRIEILPMFIDYYQSKGISQFIVGVWNGTKNPLWPEIVSLFDSKNVSYIVERSFGNTEFCGKIDSESQNILRTKYISKDEWFVIADLDEFHSFSQPDLLAQSCENAGATYVEGQLIDRITTDGHIPEKLDGDIFLQFPINALVTKQITHGLTRKVLMMKGHHFIESGHHTVIGGIPYHQSYVTYHFKWFGNVIEHLKKRHLHYDSLNLEWKEESKRITDHITKYGRIQITSDIIYQE